MPKLPVHMTPDEIIGEIRQLHEVIERSAFQMGELCRLLSVRSRQRTASETGGHRPEPAERLTGAYVTYANAWLRLSGLVVQAVRRTRVVDRSLDAERRDQENEMRREQEQAARDQRQERREQRQTLRSRPPASDLMDLYGKEIVDAAR